MSSMEQERKAEQELAGRSDRGVLRQGKDDEILYGNLRAWQERLLLGVLQATAIAGLLAAVAGTFDSLARGDLWTLPIYWGSYGAVVLFWLWPRTPYTLRVWGLVGLLWIMGTVTFAQAGRAGAARAFMLAIPFVAALFLGRRESIWALLLGTGTMVLFGVLFTTEVLTVPGYPDAGSLAGWVSSTVTNLMLSLLIVVPLNYLVPRMARALEQSQQTAQDLADQRARLEELVAERTQGLARRSAQLEAAAQVARDATAIQEVDQLLAEIVRLVSARFGFYHTGIFLLDEAREYAVLRAASSDGGQRMLARGHRLRVGEAGIVGYVTRQGKPRIALDVGEDAAYFDNPDLPETRSEVALPLRVRGEIIGALDVQSTEPEAFDQDDVTTLQTLADQVAVAISNARLFRQVQESLDAERRAYGELSREAWQELLRAQAITRRRYDPQGILPPEGHWREEMVKAARTGEPILEGDGDSPALAIPLKVREQVIGVLDAHKAEGGREWTPDEVALLQTLVDQLGVALESARLYQDTQRRAAEERLMGEITARMRETLDIDTVLQTAIQEMGTALGLSRIEVWMEDTQVSTEERGEHVAED